MVMHDWAIRTQRNSISLKKAASERQYLQWHGRSVNISSTFRTCFYSYQLSLHLSILKQAIERGGNPHSDLLQIFSEKR